ncbi:MAG: L-cystine-binding protein FliY [Chlamydiia bacterium]|nr:L-cystine-binding protein FliY [Chlamydiia bacterium]MCH9616201.1 L-cystine-binding protein FliY [Chlamydiia bacterium]MCH9629813.1 L-cystine-binding protein FliY [Chlamydiia bacterium]
MRKTALALLCLLLTCCSASKDHVRIGVDPSFFPLELQGKEAAVFAYINELLAAIGERESLDIERVNVTWDNVLFSIESKDCDTVLSSIQPYVFNRAKFDFSKKCLETGPVLIVPHNSKVQSIGDLKGSSVGVINELGAKYVIESEPSIYVRTYASFPEGLDNVGSGQYGGALVPYIPVVSYITNIYAGELRIASKPLLDEGLRFLMIKNAHPSLLKKLNRALTELEKSGKLHAMAKKWQLTM